MQYQPVFIYDGSNELLGLGIAKVGAPKLHSVNIWSLEHVDDFKRTLGNLNEEQSLRAFWPDAHDVDVARLVEDPNWEPLELHEEQIPDWDNSVIVNDEFDGIDHAQSTIVYKTALVPDPAKAQERYFLAQETVARQRASVDRSSVA